MIIDDVVRKLLVAHGAEITLDQIGEAIGTRLATPPEIEAIIDALEKKGRKVVTPRGGEGELHLKKVLDARRALGKASIADLAAHTGLTESEVRHALELAKVMQR